MITYLLKSGILLLIFYAVYKLWLENEKMFRFNRAYLISSLAFSLIIPLQLFTFNPFIGNSLNSIQLEEIIIRSSNTISDKTSIYEILNFILSLIYVVVALLLSIRFALNIYTFYKKLNNNKTQFMNGEKVILIEEPILPHSFWNAIFINADDFENKKIPSELIVHEKAHLKQKHTLDILFIEVLQIVFWFNPLLILYKKAIKINHEFLADEAVNNQFNSVTYYQNLLLGIASNKTNVALASNINYLITKKRFLMMAKKQSPIKITLKVFIVGVIYSLLLFTFSTKTVAQGNAVTNLDKSQQENSEIKNPEYPGGITEFYKLVGMNFQISPEADKNKVEGKILIKFMVEKDGSLSEFKVEKDLGYGMAEEAIRVIKLSPKWIPGSENGKAVRVEYSMPITIQAKPQE
jgi:beta-lactamase regulating signal transducer with metallopeptidase domain